MIVCISHWILISMTIYYEIFITHFQLAKNKHLPMKNVRYLKRKHKKSQWMTTGILNCINTS